MGSSESSLRYGVSLSHLISLPIPYDETFHAACEYVKKQTVGMKGYRSYARWLKRNPKTRHLVRDQATVFVSYAWGGGFGRTMDALKEQFKGKLDETFVWMDFVIVDQHQGVSTKEVHHFWLNKWRRTFCDSLKRIGRACLVLAPGEKPLAASRSWCCFEWTLIVLMKIPFSYCIPPSDETKLIERMHGCMPTSYFMDLFAGVDVEKAKAFKQSDQQDILKEMGYVGVAKVNSIVLKCLKDWLVQTAIKAEKTAPENLRPNVLLTRANLHAALGEYGIEEPLLRESLVSLKKLYGENNKAVPAIVNRHGAVLEKLGKFEAAEELYLEAMAMIKKLPDAGDEVLALTLGNVARMLGRKGNHQAAEPLHREFLAISKRLYGDNHIGITSALNNLGWCLKEMGKLAAAEQMYREALTIRQKALGDNHPTVALALNNLGTFYADKGDYVAAEPMLRQALAIQRKVLGMTHPDVAQSLENLAGTLLMKGHLEAAKALAREAQAIRRMNSPGVSA